MIYITLGNDRRPFTRLLRMVDTEEYARLSLPVCVQNGHTDYQFSILTRTTSQGFLDNDAHLQNLKNASLVISHAGAGTLIDCLNVGIIPLLLPRLAKHGEHKNDHQLEIFQYAIRRNFALPLDNTSPNSYISDSVPPSVKYSFEPILEFLTDNGYLD